MNASASISVDKSGYVFEHGTAPAAAPSQDVHPEVHGGPSICNNRNSYLTKTGSSPGTLLNARAKRESCASGHHLSHSGSYLTRL